MEVLWWLLKREFFVNIQVAKLVKSELKVCCRWTTDSSAVGLTWLDEQVMDFGNFHSNWTTLFIFERWEFDPPEKFCHGWILRRGSQGRGTLPSTRVSSLKKELVQFLLEEASSPNSSTAMCLPYGGPNPNLLSLFGHDTEATLEVLRYAFVEDGNERYNPSGIQ
ncbi:hypothetical protein P3S67_006622 [Capsicum chacoense]